MSRRIHCVNDWFASPPEDRRLAADWFEHHDAPEWVRGRTVIEIPCGVILLWMVERQTRAPIRCRPTRIVSEYPYPWPSRTHELA